MAGKAPGPTTMGNAGCRPEEIFARNPAMGPRGFDLMATALIPQQEAGVL